MMPPVHRKVMGLTGRMVVVSLVGMSGWTCGAGQHAPAVSTSAVTSIAPSATPSPLASGATSSGTEGFVNFDLAQERLGWRVLRSSNDRFAVDSFTSIITGAGSSQSLIRLPYFTGPDLRDNLILIQAPKSRPLATPPTSSRTERLGSFEAMIWVRDDGSQAAEFPTG